MSAKFGSCVIRFTRLSVSETTEYILMKMYIKTI
jgi:hypothetical protein